MPTVKMRSRGAITLPAKIRQRLGMMAGEEFEVMVQDNVVLLIPHKVVPDDNAGHHTAMWQRMMQEAFDDLKAGRIAGPFETVDELIQDLHT